MQTPKARTSCSGTPQKTSPRSTEVSQKNNSPKADSSEASQKISGKVVRQLKTSPRYPDHTASSANIATKAPKERSLKVADHRSPKKPASEKKRQSGVSELESQISQLENELKTVKDQLCSTEELKKQAEKDAYESNQQLFSLSLKLQKSQKHLTAPVSILCESSDKLDQYTTVQSDDSSALDDIKQLKPQLQIVDESEAADSEHSSSEQNELLKLKENLSETLLLVENMKNELTGCKESETRAHTLVDETLVQLEAAKNTVESLKSDGLKSTEAYNAVASELDESRARISFLEEIVSKLKADIITSKDSQSEVDSVKLEAEQLKSKLKAAEIRYNEERSGSLEEIQNALKMVEEIKSKSGQREAELESEIQKSKYEIEELKANLMDKETELQGICEENEGLSMKLETTLSGQRETELEKMLENTRSEIENLKSRLADKEIMRQKLSDENEKLKLKVKEMKVSDEIDSDIESVRAAEREAVMQVSYMSEEAEKSNRKAEIVGEQLEAVLAAKREMEAELRRLKVQSVQWRKAAEAAAAMISAGNDNNGQIMERTGSMDNHYSSPRMGKINSPYTDDLEEDLMKKKNANMMRKLGVLWKKQQK